MINKIKNIIRSSEKIISLIYSNNEIILQIDKIVNECVKCLNNKKKILLAGNGGSAAQAQHIAAEFVGRFVIERKAIAAISLTTDSSILTAIGNDYSYKKIYSRQIEALGNSNDIFIALSTSGKSPNIIDALKKAKSKNLICVGMTGNHKNNFNDLCDYIVKIPTNITSKIQEGHLVVGHVICSLVEEIIHKRKKISFTVKK